MLNEDVTEAAVAAPPPAERAEPFPPQAPLESVEAEPVSPTPVRSIYLFASYAAVGLLFVLLTFVTVHSRPSEDLAKYSTSVRSNRFITEWLREGYWHYYGLILLSGPPPVIYQSSTGGYLFTGYVGEKIYSGLTGHYGWRFLAVHNQLMSALTSILLALLTFRLARRLGLSIVHAWILGAAVEIVQFTFPDNLDLYWEMSAQAAGLLFLVAFLLLDEARLRRSSKIIPVSMFAVAVAANYMEFVAGVAFTCAYVALTVILDASKNRLKHALLTVVVPCVLVLLSHKGQVALAAHSYPDIKQLGSAPLLRSGLDGNTQWYRDHLDIVYGRKVARVNFPFNPDSLFVWKWLFIAGTMSLIAILLARAFDRVEDVHVISAGSLAGMYIVYAAAFSQSVVIHPYLYDVLLATPLMLALYGVAPALLETFLRRKGVVVAVVAFAAIWYSFYQLRLYVLRHPLPSTVSRLHDGRGAAGALA
jgi:hypothetical protein